MTDMPDHDRAPLAERHAGAALLCAPDGLSLTQFGAYMMLLSMHIRRGYRPLPADDIRACERARCDTDSERATLDTILAEFWRETPRGWMPLRALHSDGDVALDEVFRRAEGAGIRMDEAIRRAEGAGGRLGMARAGLLLRAP